MRYGAFKYMKRQYAKDLVKHGRIRLGTGYEYTRVDNLGSEIGDLSETAVFFNIPTDEIEKILADKNPNSLSVWVREMVQASPEARLFKRFLVQFRDNDTWMYCISMVHDPASMEKFGYDTCVEIVDQKLFLSSICLAVDRFAEYVGTAACRYNGKEASYWQAHKVAPYLMKDARYSHQCEARAIWAPRQSWLVAKEKFIDQNKYSDPVPRYVLEPLFLELPELRESVRIVG